MNFTQNDFAIIMASSIAIIAMSFVFPPLGLTSQDKVAENEIPEFNITTEEFKFTDEFPENPGSPSQGTLEFSESLAGDSDNQIFLDGDTDNGTELVLLNNGNLSEPEPQVRVNNWDSGMVTTDIYNFSQVGDIQNHDNFSYEIKFTYLTLENVNKSSQTYVIRYQIETQPENTNWIKRIPVVGGVVGAGEQLAGIIGWIGSVIWWFLSRTAISGTNILNIVYQVLFFIIDLMSFLIGTYTDIVTNANEYAAILVLIPGLLLSLEFGKLVYIGITVIPGLG